VAWRGLALTLVPGSADAVPPFAPLAPAGWLLLLLAPLLLIASRGRPSLGALLVPLPFLLPAIPASVTVGLNADRYFYVVFAGMGVAIALLLSDWIAQRPRREGWRAAPRMQLSLALGLALILGAMTLERSGDWTDNETLFRASLERNRDNAYAAFHLGHELHVRQGDCEAALPFYRAAMSIDRRAGNNRQACLLELGRMHEAAAMGPALVKQDPENPSPAANTARALVRLGDLESAESFVREALVRDAARVRSWVLLGNVLGLQGRHGEAADAFERALALGPDDHQARRGLRIAQQLTPL
jgi:tetratricopeptide (TPR) repeat protein